MKHPSIFLIAGLLGTVSAWAVYAPVPEPQQGREFTFSVRGGFSHDSNIFGSATGAIESNVYQLAPKVAFNASVTDQTFVSASYQLSLDYFDKRPGEKTLDSHDLQARMAHSFSPVTTLDLTEAFVSAKNPESLLAGVPINTDQSNYRNQFDARFATAPAPKTGLTVKARSLLYDYRNAILSRSLDRTENLYGLSGDFALLPETKLVVEYRHQDVLYRTGGATKNKHSDFLMAGADYAPGPKISGSARLGFESRRRSGERSTTSPYAELSGKYDYGKQAFVSGGYVYTLEESSDTTRFTDTQVNRFFVNVQHPLAPSVIASGSINYEPTQLQGRRGQRDLNENNTRLGLALHYTPTKNWTVSANYDYDHVTSDDAARQLERHRTGVSATFAF